MSHSDSASAYGLPLVVIEHPAAPRRGSDQLTDDETDFIRWMDEIELAPETDTANDDGGPSAANPADPAART